MPMRVLSPEEKFPMMEIPGPVLIDPCISIWFPVVFEAIFQIDRKIQYGLFVVQSPVIGLLRVLPILYIYPRTRLCIKPCKLHYMD